jgi:hypothetical protein
MPHLCEPSVAKYTLNRASNTDKTGKMWLLMLFVKNLVYVQLYFSLYIFTTTKNTRPMTTELQGVKDKTQLVVEEDHPRSLRRPE